MSGSTPHKWLRYSLDHAIPMLGHSDDIDVSATVTEMLDVLELGSEHGTRMRELLAGVEFHHDLDLHLLWYGDIDDLIAAGDATITWTNPYLMAWNGDTGHLVGLKATIARPFDRDMLRLDEGPDSFSTGVCGGLHDILHTEVTIECTD